MYPPSPALSDAVFATPMRLVGGPAPLAPAPPQPGPRTRKARPDLEYLAGGDRWGTLGGYLRSLPPWVDNLTYEFGPDLYDRMQLDDQVSSSLRALVFSVLSDDLVLRPGVDKEKDPDFAAAKEVLGFMERATWEGRGGTDEWLFAMARGALGGGNRVSETVLRVEESGRDAGKLVLDRLAVKPRRAVSFVVDQFNRLVGIAGVIPGQYGSAAPYGTTFAADGPPTPNLLPREKFCVASWDPPDGDPRGSALLRCIYEPWWAKLGTAREWMASLTQFGSPSLVGTTAPGADSSAVTDGYGNPVPDGVVLTPEQDFLNQILALRNGTAIVIPAGATLEALKVPNAGDAFLKKVDACDRAIAQGVLLAMRAVMQSRFGSRADAEQGQDVAGLQARFVKRWLARMVTEDLLRYLYRVNYGPNADPRLCPYASLSPVEHQDLGTGLVAVSTAFKAGVIKPSQLPWVHEQFGMPPATPEELAAPAQPPAAPGAGGAGPDPLAQALLKQGPPGGGAAPFAFDPGQPRVPAGSAEGGEWGSGGGGPPVAEKPPPAGPRVDVGLTDREEAAIAKIVKGPLKIKGGLTPERLAALGGAPDGGQVTVRPGADKKSLTIHVSNDFSAVSHLRRLGSGELIVYLEHVKVRESAQGRGLGSDFFGRQVDAARALGVGSVRCHAARQGGFNGYYTWPRLGYDTDFEDLEDQGDKALADRARAAFPGAESVLQVIATPEGRAWWRQNGTDLHRAKFDLADGSPSMAVFSAYREERARG